MGRHTTPPTRCAQMAVATHMLGGVLAIAASYSWQTVCGTLAIAVFGCGQWLLHRALGGWLGHRARLSPTRRRPRRRGPQDWLSYRWATCCMLVLVLAVPVGYALGWDNPRFQMGWSHVGLAAMLLVVARATLFPLRAAGRDWRWLLCACLMGMAMLLLARAAAGELLAEQVLQLFNLLLALAVNVVSLVATLALLAAWRDEAKARLRSLAMTDGLTGLLNRRGWQERAESMFANAQRYQQPLTLMMLDIDHFKRINDTHGHEVGDLALKLFARLLRESRRTGDLVGRLGGEEFCIVLANTHKSASIGFEQRLRSVLVLRAEQELGFPLDFSGGVAVLKEGDGTLTGLLARADAALYEAKRQGRGRVLQSEGGMGQTVI
jgi:diguanylate cyclase (GGDEF)-like protein